MIDPTLLILASLAEGEKHGYAIMTDVQEFAGVRLGAGTLYGAITRLERQGWIKVINSDERRKPYRLTGEGKRFLEERMAGLESLLKTTRNRLRHA